MKKILLLVSVFSLCTSASGIYFAITCSHPWLASGSAITGVASMLIFLFLLKRFTISLMSKSGKTLNLGIDSKRASWFIFDLLEENQNQIIKKFQTASRLIGDLIHPELIDPVAELGIDDPLGNALLGIKKEMIKIKDEDQKRAWISEGLAKFAEIIKQRSDINEFGKEIISALVRYLNVNQGGIFILKEHEGERYLELAACYAYAKQKYLVKKIYEGQGLIGQCMFEKALIFITDVPKDYIKITSGLGESTPGNVVVAPLIFSDVLCGVIEIASFEILQPHHIEFLKKVCTNIAAELVSLKNADQTRTLLEDSNLLTKELTTREHEMKANLEELALTQEKMIRNQAELKGYLAGVNNTIACSEFDLDGTFRSGNEIFLKVMGYQENDLAGKNFKHLMGEDAGVVMMWENLRLGHFFSGEFRVKSRAGKELWLTGTFNPIVIDGKVPEKIVMLAQFTTQEKEKLNDLNAMVSALKATLPVIEFNENFICKTANDKAMQMFGLTRLQLRSKTIHDFIAPAQHKEWNALQSDILKKDFSNVVLPFVNEIHVVNYEVSVSLVRNYEGQVQKVIMLFVKQVADLVPAFVAE